MLMHELIVPLERLRDEAMLISDIKDLHYLFVDFVKLYKSYVSTKDHNSFSLLSSNEIACISRFSENDPFLSDSLMVILDIMELVRMDYFNDNDEKDKQHMQDIMSAVVEEINRITFFDENDPVPDDFNN